MRFYYQGILKELYGSPKFDHSIVDFLAFTGHDWIG